MRRDGNNILITLDEWMAAGLSYKTYENDRQRRYLQTANRACYGNGVEIIWGSIAKEGRRAAIVARHGKPEDVCSVSQFADSIGPDAKAQQFYNDYLLPDGRHLPAERIVEYTANVEVLNAIICGLADWKGRKRSLGGSVRGLLANLTDSANKLNRVQFPHTLPSNERRMRDAIARYKSEGYMAFVHKNFTNKHAAKVNDEVKESLMTELLSDPRNLDNEQIRSLYNIIADKMDWKPITASAVGWWRNKLDLVSYAGRRGETALRNSRMMQVKRVAPSYPLYYWTADGWDVELLFQETRTDKKGHATTTYHNRPTVVVVLDPCEKYPIGYAIGDHETPELIKEAMRNAVNHTAELFGQRYRAHQLQTDHYAIKTMAGVYGAVADKHTPARVKNAKAKIVEPYFNSINKQYCQLMPNWSGFGLTSKKDSQPNVDYINKHRHLFPDREACYAQVRRIVEMERAAKRERYMKRWADLPVESRLEMSTADYLYQFGSTTGNKNLLEGSGIRPTIGGVVRDYDCFDVQFREYYGTRWTVLYDPDNLREALAVNDDGSLRFVLQEKYVQPMALAERKESDSEQLAAVNQFNKRLEQRIIDRRAKTGKKVQELFCDNPKLDDTLTKMLIVDSRGQHKNRRNDHRLERQTKHTDYTDIAAELAPVLVLTNGQLEEETEINQFDLY